MMTRGFWFFLAGSVGVLALGPHASAGTQMTIVTDKSSLITLSAEPATVVIGNPAIADVSLNGKQVFIHGHAFGDTNLLILDAAGNKIADFDISVGHVNTNMMAIFSGGGFPKRISYSCAPYCETTIMPGDPIEYTKDLISVSAGKTKFATGKETAEAAAPAAPQ